MFINNMNSYELILIFDPNQGEERIEEDVSKIEDRIKNLGGELEKTDKWGVRKLAGRFKRAKKLTQAYYVVIYFRAESSLPGSLQSYLKVTENIIRYFICRAAEARMPVAEIEAAPAVEVGEIEGRALGES